MSTTTTYSIINGCKRCVDKKLSSSKKFLAPTSICKSNTATVWGVFFSFEVVAILVPYVLYASNCTVIEAHFSGKKKREYNKRGTKEEDEKKRRFIHYFHQNLQL
jgi:hypothetical protein